MSIVPMIIIILALAAAVSMPIWLRPKIRPPSVVFCKKCGAVARSGIDMCDSCCKPRKFA